MRESLAKKTIRAGQILNLLHDHYPDADCALQHRSAWQLLIATILSAQSTDETVNRVTPRLFRRFPSPAALSQAETAEVEKLIYATGFFRQKARHIINSSRIIMDQHGGEVPADLEQLILLPGVARKTANVILGTWFKQNVGIVVDTHVGRIAHRLAMTWNSRDTKDAVKIERDLQKILPQAEWTFISHALIWHGRKICQARRPDCLRCPLLELCPSAQQPDAVLTKKKKKSTQQQR
ncbi:MAG: Ultraviolet N-glycosylase/AP lyase [Phycisphaerae bacterium]|nr:Ultraviolet N-glycosylase/AP lyase [Phycisphaerae bacterium]